MHVLLINGSPHREGCTYTALHEVAYQLKKYQIESTIFHIGNGPVRGCIGCGRCKEKGFCVFEDDAVNECIALAREADAVVLGTPVHYASAAGAASAFFDRMFYASGRYFALKLGAAVVSCRRGGASAAFDRLNKYFTISQMPVVSSQYWNSVHGNTPDEVRQDLEGMQVMRTLGDNLAWLLQCIDAAKDTVSKPEREAPVKTNFIR